AAVVAHRRHQPVRAAVGPAVLLPESGDVIGIGRAHRKPGLHFTVRKVEVGAREAALGSAAAARRELRRDADVDRRSDREWRSRRGREWYQRKGSYADNERENASH